MSGGISWKPISPDDGKARIISDFVINAEAWDGESFTVRCDECDWEVHFEGVVRRGLVSCPHGLLTEVEAPNEGDA